MKPKRILQLVFVVLAMAIAALVVYKIVLRIKAHNNLAFKYEFRKKDISQRGFILMAPYVTTSERYSQLIIMGLAGNIVYQKKVAGIVGDFRQWLVDGHTRYSYAVYDPAVFLQNYSNGSVAHVVVLDSAMNEIKQVHLLAHGDIVVDKYQGLDHHDIIMVSDEHYVVMASHIKQVTNIPDSLSPAPRVKVAVPIIQEINNGAVTWQWDASVHPEFYAASLKGNHFSDSINVQDYMHINGIAIDPGDSNLVASFHNTNQLIKIDRQSGAILWRLGGKNSDFALTVEQEFYRQHNPSFINNGNTLLLLDNGDSSLRKVSRVLEFTLDEENKKIAKFKSYNIPAAFAMSKGNVELAGNDYFICGGSANYILKVNRHTRSVNTELLYNHTSFRAYLVNDITGSPGYRKHR